MDMVEENQLRELLKFARQQKDQNPNDHYYQGYLDALEDVFEDLGIVETGEEETAETRK